LPRTPLIINTDPHRLRQVLINLISNALKFTVKGYVCVLAKKKDLEESLALQVIDTGIGMNSSEQRALFQAFGKLKTSKAMNKQGCGLGLMISKTLIEAMGGTISVRSQKNVGSKFIISIPLRQKISTTAETDRLNRGRMESELVVHKSEMKQDDESNELDLAGLEVMVTPDAKFMENKETVLSSERGLLT